MVENSMVMPTGVNTNRNRQRRVVFYGRVSSEHENMKRSCRLWKIKFSGMTILQQGIKIGWC